MNHHSKIKSSFLDCEFAPKMALDCKSRCKFKHETSQFNKSFGSFKICDRLCKNSGTDFKSKLKQIIKSQKTSITNFYKNLSSNSRLNSPENSSTKSLSDEAAKTQNWSSKQKPDFSDKITKNNTIGQLILNSPSQSMLGINPDLNDTTATFTSECLNGKMNASPFMKAANESTFTYCNEHRNLKQTASKAQKTSELSLQKDKRKSNIELHEIENVHNENMNKEEENVNIKVENDTSQENYHMQSFGEIVKRYGIFEGYNIFLASKEKMIQVAKTEITKDRIQMDEEMLSKNKFVNENLEQTKTNKGNEIISNSKQEIPKQTSDHNVIVENDLKNCNDHDTDIMSDHTYIRHVSSEHPPLHNDYNNNDHGNSLFDDNDDSLCIQIDQNKIKAIKKEILSNFRMSTDLTKKVPQQENYNKSKRKLDCDHYDETAKKIKLVGNSQSEVQTARKYRNIAKTYGKRSATDLGGVKLPAIEKMDIDDGNEFVAKKNISIKIPVKRFKRDDNDYQHEDSIMNRKNIESEIMEICEENEIATEEYKIRETEENEEMESDGPSKQTIYDTFCDTNEASDDQMRTSDIDVQIQPARNWDSTELDDNETTKDMDFDEVAINNKPEDKMDDEESTKDDQINNNEDKKISLRPRRYRTFLLTKERRSRAFLKQRSRILGRWFVSHFSHPYPTKLEKDQLSRESNMPRNQVSEWFGNMRRRIREATRGQHLTWEEKVKRYNDLISGKSEPLPILPGDLINDHVEEGAATPDDTTHGEDPFSNALLSPKFKRTLMQRYMNDYSELKTLPNVPLNERSEIISRSSPEVDPEFYDKKNIESINTGETIKEIPLSNVYLLPIWGEIRINAKKQVECVNDLGAEEDDNGIRNGIINISDSSTSWICIEKSNMAVKNRRNKNNQPSRRVRRNCKNWIIDAKSSNLNEYSSADDSHSPKKNIISYKFNDVQQSRDDDDNDDNSNERPCSESKRIKTNVHNSSFLECSEKKDFGSCCRSSDEIDAAYSLMELQRML